MGIVDEELASFELPAYGRCQIEADVNGNVHLHFGPLRVELSSAEFLEFAAVVMDGQARLHEVKDGSEEAVPPPDDEVVDAA